ncbi:hypothetical protein [Ligilactobacillus cholophilus]|uniref:hypothetical protein n=1 Tax=Ligilactobacillus cholophilus TaxID=3050131 RepID=UPI0025B197EA|nr:hypothetical protein [Ligilactobacillus cholophilus]
MDKQAIINELTRTFIRDKDLNKLMENSNQETLIEMYQGLFNLWNEELSINIIYQKKSLLLVFSQAVFTDIINNKQGLNKRIIEITTLLSLSNNEKEFRMMFERKFKQALPRLTPLFNENYEDNLSDFDKKMRKALNFNWKEGK